MVLLTSQIEGLSANPTGVLSAVEAQTFTLGMQHHKPQYNNLKQARRTQVSKVSSHYIKTLDGRGGILGHAFFSKPHNTPVDINIDADENLSQEIV